LYFNQKADSLEITSLLILFSVCASLSTVPEEDKTPGVYRNIEYNLNKPDIVYLLSHELREISGITIVNRTTIACIQDEHGTIFFQDIGRNEITGRINFGPSGDYEDIARVGETYYIVKSDKVLTEVRNPGAASMGTKVYMTGVPGHDIEGLCYDRKNNRLLIVPKEAPKEENNKNNKRYIYAFDLASKKLIQGPVLEFDVGTIGKFCMEHDIRVPMKPKKKGKKDEPDIKFRISAFGINPVTNKLYLISGSEHLIFVSDMSGNIEYVSKLKNDLFPQPEGITFMENGDMFISNEGRGGQGTIIRFNYKSPGK
jgi:hypothetical protein